MNRSYVVTGGGRGVGRAIVERMLKDADDNRVVVIEFDAAELVWVDDHPAHSRLIPVVGDAGEEAVASRAADRAAEMGPLAGWVNNAAVFRDAWIHLAPVQDVLDTIVLNLNLAVVGSGIAVRHFLAEGTGGAIVNVSSHQAQRSVRGAMPYATAKAAIEGLTRALAVDYGPLGIRVNAVALGSIVTERSQIYLAGQEPEAVKRFEEEMRLLHPIGRMGRTHEVAAAVSFLLSDEASFISGAVVPVDGGRAAQGRDPEES